MPVAGVLEASVLIEGEGAAALTGDARGVNEKVAADIAGDAGDGVCDAVPKAPVKSPASASKLRTFFCFSSGSGAKGLECSKGEVGGDGLAGVKSNSGAGCDGLTGVKLKVSAG